MQRFKKLLCFSVTAACLASQAAPAMPAIAAEGIVQEVETTNETTDIGTDIVEVLAASSELAGSEKSDTEALKEKIDSIQKDYENLPEEDQAALTESMEALSNAEVAVDKSIEDKEAIENGEPIVIEENDKPNSWRYVNGERIDDAIEVVQDEVLDASGEDITEGTELISINDGEVLLGVESDRYDASYKFGIDVSYHNGSINWSTIDNNGTVKYAIIRCGYGSDISSQDDSKWSYNSSQCEKYGIPYGTYLYSYATSTSKVDSEAEHVLRLIKGKNMQLPIFYDMEENSQFELGRSTVVSYATRFCNKIKNAGYKVGIYANKNWYDNRLGTYLNSNTDIYAWIARYNSTLGYSGNYDLWQYSSTGSVSGVSGNVDVNRWYTTIPTSAKLNPTYNITCNYYSGYARKDSESGKTFTSNNVYIGTETYPYGSSAFSEYGLDNATNGAFNLSAPGYTATGYWILGSLSGTTKIHQDSTFATSQALAKACGQDLSKGNVTLNFYAEFVPNKVTINSFNVNGGTIANAPFKASWSSTYFKLNGSTVQGSSSATGTFTTTTDVFNYNSNLDPWDTTTMGMSRTGYHIDETKMWKTTSGDTNTSSTKILDHNTNAWTLLGSTTASNSNYVLYANWLPNTLKINYYSGAADAETNNSKTYNGTNTLVQTTTYSYNGTSFADNGLPDAYGGMWKFTKSGYSATGNWLVGSTTSSTKINQSTKYATVQDLAKAAGKDLGAGNVEINLYPEFKQLAITGVSIDKKAPVYGDTLTATVTPADASVTYQWYNSDGAISGATGKTYKPTENDVLKNITVKVTGANGYAGNASATTTSPVQKIAVTSVALDNPRPVIGDTLTAVTTPTNANVTYQWYNSDGIIKGATGRSYTPTEKDILKQIRVYVKGAGAYEGDVTVRTAAPVQRIYINSVKLDTPRPVYGDTITAVIDPAIDSATGITYQWYNSNGIIKGATSKTYKPTANDIGKHLRVYVKGTGIYGNTVTVRTTAPVQKISITGVELNIPNPEYGDTLTATVSPENANVTYQWYNSDGAIKGATGRSYKPTEKDINKNIRVVVKGADVYTGSATDKTSAPVLGTSLSGVLLDNPRPTCGDTITAVTSPANATATYQWYNSSGKIEGATGKTYTITESDIGKQIRVYVTGTGKYSGTASVRTAAPVQRK